MYLLHVMEIESRFSICYPYMQRNMSESCRIGKPLDADGRRQPNSIAIEGLLVLAATDVRFDTTIETHRSRDWPVVICLLTTVPRSCSV